MPTIRDYRIEQELPQPALAARAGVSTGTIVRLEAGERVSKEVVKKICAALGVDPSEVTGINYFIPVKHRQRRNA